MKLCSRLFFLFLAVFLCAGSCFSHSGRTDSSGGHNGAGGYHYHHGYPAHQHTGGTCPYNFDDRTGWNSGPGSSENKKTESAKEVAEKKQNKPKFTKDDLVAILFISALPVFLLVRWLVIIVRRIIENKAAATREEIRRKAELDEQLQFFGGLSAREKAGVPSYIAFDEYGWPIDNNPVLYTLNKYGTKYHTTSCYYSTGPHIRGCRIPNDALPCCKCRPPLPDRPKWLYDYRRYIQIKTRFGIPDPDIPSDIPCPTTDR